jgi:hypothetical protein
MSSGKDYFRPRGDITTVLDLTARDSQDNTYFPLDTDESYFHRDEFKQIYPTSLSIQEFTQRGPADWGQKFTFEIGSLNAGDLLQAVILQFKVGSWYNGNIIKQLYNGNITPDMSNNSDNYWTYINSLGTAIIEYADFVVKDQTIERITGEFIRTFFNAYSDVNSIIGIASDAIGAIPYQYLNTSVVNTTEFSANRPYPTEDGTFFCILPFFFLRTRLSEVFPLLSCNEGNVRIDIKLRPFHEVTRRYIGYRQNCDATPLNSYVYFNNLSSLSEPAPLNTTLTKATPPQFRDFRILTACSLLSGSLREQYLHRPFEQMVRIVKSFYFEEPLKYLVSKPNPNTNTVEIQLPLELNHPTTELLWVFRRKAVLINNEWANFTPAISYQSKPEKIFPEWLEHASIRLNGSELISAKGNWYREHIASVHKGGITSYNSYVYGYSFARYPEKHQPSGTANMSRTTSIMLNLNVNIPIPINTTSIESSYNFDPITVDGWEVFVYAIHMNWLRFENGICNPMFTD